MRGLQFRSHLPANRGMLFIFKDENQIQKFWMKDTRIPLDMIWLDQEGRIIEVLEDVPPCVADPCPVYGPDEPAAYVLELNAGTADDLGLKERAGERFVLKVSKNQALDR